MSGGAPISADRTRQARERRGRWAETIAAAYLRFKGFRILDKRFKVPSGEIDIIAMKGRRIAFIEVKARTDLEACEASITPKLRARVRRAADIWMGKHEAHGGCDMSFDIIFIRPRRWPVYLKDAL